MAIATTRPNVVRSDGDIEDLQQLIRNSAWRACQKIFELDQNDPMEVLHALKFEAVGDTPLAPVELRHLTEQPETGGEADHVGELATGRPQRLTEQLYRTFKAMTTLAAARRLGPVLFPRGLELCLRLGYFSQKDSPNLHWHSRAFRGPEIESIPTGIVDAEVISAVSTVSNAALKKAFDRLASLDRADNRFVFFYAPDQKPGRREDLERRLLQQVQFPEHHRPEDIKIIALEKHEIM